MRITVTAIALLLATPRRLATLPIWLALAPPAQKPKCRIAATPMSRITLGGMLARTPVRACMFRRASMLVSRK